MDFQSIHTPKAPKPVGPYPHARRVGPFLFLSGIGPRKPGEKSVPGVTLNENGEVLSYDFKTQCHQVFKNIKEVLEASDALWEDLVDITVFLTNMKEDFSTFNEIYAEYFSGEIKPCRTTVEVTALPTPIAIELKCIAFKK